MHAVGVVMHAGGVVMHAGGVAMHAGGVAMHAGGVVVHAGGVVMHAGGVVVHAGGVVMHAGGVVMHAGGVVMHAGGVVMHAGGVVMHAGGVVVHAGGVVVHAGGVVVHAGGVVMHAGGVVMHAGGVVNSPSFPDSTSSSLKPNPRNPFFKITRKVPSSTGMKQIDNMTRSSEYMNCISLDTNFALTHVHKHTKSHTAFTHANENLIEANNLAASMNPHTFTHTPTHTYSLIKAIKRRIPQWQHRCLGRHGHYTRRRGLCWHGCGQIRIIH